ncbi:MAG: glycosyltransferase family 4 protein [Waddliaceae bacterium]
MPRKIRVAHVMNSFGLGGVPVVVYNLLKELPRERYKCYLYCLKKKSDYLEIREEQRKQFRRMSVKVSFPEGSERKFDVIGDLCRWLSHHKIEILHTHSYRPNIYGRIAGVLFKDTKIVAHYHNHYDDMLKKDNSYIFEQQLDLFSDRLIACSNSVSEHVVKTMGVSQEKIDVIQNGVDLDPFQTRYLPENVKKELQIPYGSKVVGMVGRICEQKAQDDFIRAAAIIQKSFPDTVFLIVGQADDDCFLQRLKALIRDLGIDRAVRFVGYQPNIPLVFSALDVFVLPSRWEGLPLILVEAMAAGKSIVATNIGPNSEAVSDDTALLVPPSSPDSIASKVIYLLNNPERSKDMGLRGKERAKLFSWKQAALQLDSLYQKLLEEGV